MIFMYISPCIRTYVHTYRHTHTHTVFTYTNFGKRSNSRMKSACIHAYIQVQDKSLTTRQKINCVQICIYTCMHACMQENGLIACQRFCRIESAQMHIYTHTYIHTCIHTYMTAEGWSYCTSKVCRIESAQMHIHTYIHACIYTYIHA